jgi:hypothetical protein
LGLDISPKVPSLCLLITYARVVAIAYAPMSSTLARPALAPCVGNFSLFPSRRLSGDRLKLSHYTRWFESRLLSGATIVTV